MSHSFGAVLTKDKTILYCEYNGTVDVMIPFLYDTMEECSDHWRRPDWKQCNNIENHIHHRVRIATTYGRGFSWDGFMCVECKCLLSPLEPDYESLEDGYPDWLPEDLRIK